jgi:hypothetical protein
MKKIVIAALGTLAFAAASAAPAAAAPYHAGVRVGPPLVKVCVPTYKTVKVHRNHRWVWVKVKTGTKCHWERRVY